MSTKFIDGNVAMAEAAVAAGCRLFAGFPITPQSPMPEYLSGRLPEVGGSFIQAESEVVSANILLGASYGGLRCMTSTSGPGFSLMAEGISFIIGCEAPCVFIDVARPGPGMGGIGGCSQDYLYAVKGLGAGGGRAFVISPSTIQEAVHIVYESFDIADRYRTPVVVLTDKLLAATTEVVELPPLRALSELPDKSSWLITKRDSMKFEDKRICQSMLLPVSSQEEFCIKLADKYKQWEEKETRYEEFMLEDAEVVLFAYGSVGRIVREAVRQLRKEGVKAGLFRPVTLFPFPRKQIGSLHYERIKKAICVEMAIPGQMLEDVERSVKGRIEVDFYGRGGGMLVTPEEVGCHVKQQMEGSGD